MRAVLGWSDESRVHPIVSHNQEPLEMLKQHHAGFSEMLVVRGRQILTLVNSFSLPAVSRAPPKVSEYFDTKEMSSIEPQHSVDSTTMKTFRRLG